MKKEKLSINTIIIIGVALITISLVAFISIVTINNVKTLTDNKEKSNETNTNHNSNSSENSNVDNNTTNNEIENNNNLNNNSREDTNNNTTNNNNTSSNNNNTSQTSPNNEETNGSNTTTPPKENNTAPNITISSETDLISYLQTEESSMNSSLGDKAKHLFVTVVDFIFYDGQIGGYTFNQLSTSAKLQVLKIALSIDSKIDKYFPGYKESISSTYQMIKNKVVELYLDLTTKACEAVRSDVCNDAIEGFNAMKESFGLTWDFLVNLAKSSWTKLGDWYEIWRSE